MVFRQHQRRRTDFCAVRDAGAKTDVIVYRPKELLFEEIEAMDYVGGVMDAQESTNGCPGWRRLQTRCRGLERRVRELEGSNSALREQVRVLAAELEKTQRAGKRQAVPFRRKNTAGKPKKPGRKAGKDCGTHARRAAPIDEKHDAPLPPACPKCGSEHMQENRAAAEQFQTDVVFRTVRRQFTVHCNHVRGCRELVRSKRSAPAGVVIGG